MKNIKSYIESIHESSASSPLSELNDLLMRCIRSGSKDRCVQVLDLGADANGTAYDRPLHEAIRKGNLSIVRLLLERGAKTNKKDKNGLNALMLAVYYDEPEICERLLYLDAPMGDIDDEGRTALHIAAEMDHIDCMEVLLDNRAPIEKKDGDGNTALMTAVWELNKDSVHKLIERGANIETMNNDGHTPLCYAVRKENKEMIKFLLDHGAQINYETRYEVRQFDYGDESLAEERPLEVAIWKKSPTIARFLIENGADPMKDFESVDDMLEFFGEDATWLVDYLPEGPERASLARSTKSKKLFGI